ncbi:hypothetical protein AMJ85_09765, partial [candidate division BRC1 bacterium SM23_51]
MESVVRFFIVRCRLSVVGCPLFILHLAAANQSHGGYGKHCEISETAEGKLPFCRLSFRHWTDVQKPSFHAARHRQNR